jgi:transposase
MANVLPKEKQVAVISALAEGASLRAITRMTGIHRSTIAGLALRVGQGCATLLDEKMRDLTCNYLQFDELWGFIGKKEKHRRPDDDPTLGDVWTFCAIDAETFPRSRLASATMKPRTLLSATWPLALRIVRKFQPMA